MRSVVDFPAFPACMHLLEGDAIFVVVYTYYLAVSNSGQPKGLGFETCAVVVDLELGQEKRERVSRQRS